MSHQIDYSILDQPHILKLIFYPRKNHTSTPTGAVDYIVPMEESASISCRFYTAHIHSPTILYFHGNGEVVCDYDDIAPYFNNLGVNLFVSDYRGYGQSSGRPSFSNLVSDAPVIFDYFHDILNSNGYTGSLFIMGKSMGSLPAIALAYNRPRYIDGLIIESASANLGNLLTTFFPDLSSDRLDNLEKAYLERVQSISVRTIFIHGENDNVIPLELAKTFYKNIGSGDKRLLIISGAGHTDLISTGMEQYLSAIKDFIFQQQE